MNKHGILFVIALFVSTLNIQQGFSQDQHNHLCSHKASFSRSLIGDTIDAVFYEIHINEVDYVNKTIDASTLVRLTTKVDNLGYIPLELKDLTVTEVVANGSTVTNFTHEDEMIRIPLDQAINIGDTIEVAVSYNGEPFHEGWGGFHFAGYYAFNLGVGFESDPHNLGKAWFPCVDDFQDRATYDVYVTVPLDEKGICGGELISVTPNPDNTHTFYWSLQQSIPTYLASVAVGDYELVDDIYNGIVNDIPITIYTKPNDTANVAGSFANLKDITLAYENHFSQYVWNRIGYTGTSIGAMEHVTNIAYPHFAINGGLGYESLLAHELSHMWFGDLVTCASAEDMWLNEGWAVFCESLYMESVYSNEEAKLDRRDRHEDVLRRTHITDGGYYALYGVPTDLTYGSTVYDKGGTVVQSMRTYLGDSIFFDAVRAYVQAFAYNHASSHDMRDFFTSHTGIDMTGFFDTWVFTPGTPHYSIDSIAVYPISDYFEVHVYSKNKHKGYDYNGVDHRYEITFMDADWNLYTDTIHFSGKTGHSVKIVATEPVQAFVDLEENMEDATTDNYLVIDEAGNYSFPETYFSLEVQDITDSAFVRVTHNWAAPDSMINAPEGLRLSDYRYWKVQGIFPENFTAKAAFVYNRVNYLDNTLITNNDDSLLILYRPDASYDWQYIPFEQFGSWSVGNIFVENMQAGEYTLAIWDATYVGVSNPETSEVLNVFPNPSHHSFTVQFLGDPEGRVEIYSLSGAKIDQFNVRKGKNIYEWVPDANLTEGNYFLKYIDGQDRLTIQKLMYLK